MAYLQQEQDDEENKQQSPLGGGTGAAPMTQGAQSARGSRQAASPMQPQRSAMQGTGSNFANLHSFLSPTVAKENQSKVQTLGSSLQTEEKTAFEKAAQPLRDASFKSESAGRVNQGTVDMNVDNLGTGGKSADDSFGWLEKMATQDHDGPDRVDYTVGEAGKRAGLLGNADTALNALNPTNYSNNLPSANYGQGNQWLDEAMVKGDRGTMGEIGKVNAGNEAFDKATGEEMAALGKKVSGIKDQYKAERERIQGLIGNSQASLLNRIDQKVAANQQQAGNTRAQAEADGLVWTKDGWRKADTGQMGDAWQNGNASRENTVTQQQSQTLAKLRELLGSGGTVTKNGDFAGPTRGSVADPNYVPPQATPVSDEYADRGVKMLQAAFANMDGNFAHGDIIRDSYAKAFAQYSPEEKNYVVQRYLSTLTDEQKRNPNVQKTIDAIMGKAKG